MKNLFLYLLVLLFLSCDVDHTKEKRSFKQNETLSSVHLLDRFNNHPIIFYNVENLFDTINDPNTNDDEFTPSGSKKWSAKRYKDKLEKLSKVITTPSDKNPLLIGLSEVENRIVVLDLIQTGRLAKTKYRIAHFNSPDRRGIDVALAFDLERFFLLHSEAIPVRIENESDFKTRDILYVKGLLKDSIPLHVFVNHWSSRYGGAKKSEYKRIAAAKRLKLKSDSILNIDPEANIIYMGDFNDYPTNTSIEDVLNAKSTRNTESKQFVNLLASYHKKGKGTHNYRGKWGALDQLMISPAIDDKKTIKVTDDTAAVIYEDFLLYKHPSGDKTPNKTYGGPNYYGGYSDHLAVYLFLSPTEK
ncbi:MAG: hypothetical protein WEA99_03975 [Brumimicrobium sp.]